MSFLTPLYILGALAIAAPLVFHLIRRTPRGEVPFSSLMFLTPTPPRLTRRSRLDQILLLLLRAAALGLLALAFARPFLREVMQLDLGETERQRVAILIDTSASMRRGQLWPQAKAVAKQVVAECRPGDQLAVFAFDVTTRPLLTFEDAATLDSSRRRSVALARLEEASPTWAATRLDQALIDTVSAIEGVADASEKTGRMPRRIVLISDLQQGSRVEGLGDFEWPSDVSLELKPVVDAHSNAGLQSLAEAPDDPNAATDGLRVRVANDAESHRETFHLRWVDGTGKGVGKEVDVYVPPGESRVVSVPRSSGPGDARTLRLEGDEQSFDNVLYAAAESPRESTVLYVGRDAKDDPEGLSYYLRRVFTDGARAKVHVEAEVPSSRLTAEWDEPRPALSILGRGVRLVIVSAETTSENSQRLRQYLERGGSVLYVLTSPGRPETLAALAGGVPTEIDEAPGPRDALLGEIAFDHPLFAPLAGAQFNDFTKIRFWKHRRLPADAFGDAKVLARFETGDPALVEKPVGHGRLFVLASGWNPIDSQLARSSKFVPLMLGLLELGDSRPFAEGDYHVADRVPLPEAPAAGAARTVRKPDGEAVSLEPGATTFERTDLPGVYSLDGAAGTHAFAVNLDPSESKTVPLHVEALEQFGCRLATGTRSKPDPEHLRQLHNAELEGRQKLWRWLIVAAVVVLLVETWLAGRVAQPRAELVAP